MKLEMRKDGNLELQTGTSLKGYMPEDTTYGELVRVFGEPNGVTDDYKVDAQWVGTLDGRVFTIYNYKTGRNYLGSDGKDVEKLVGVDWHIGGKDKEITEDVISYFNSI